MIHPLFKLIIAQPDWAAEHLAAYAGLVRVQALHVLRQWRWQLVLLALAVLSAVMAVGLFFMALLLWAALPAGTLGHPWVLWGVPAGWLFLAAVAGVWSQQLKRRQQHTDLALLRSQWQADLALLREMQP